jgi:hypothetical protein
VSFYSDMAAVASGVLAEFKQGTVVLTHMTDTGSPLDADAPWLGNVLTPVDYTLSATVKGVSEEFINGTTIVATDLEITAAVFAVDPDKDDTVTIDGKAVSILKVMRIPAAGDVVAWKLVVRG